MPLYFLLLKKFVQTQNRLIHLSKWISLKQYVLIYQTKHIFFKKMTILLKISIAKSSFICLLCCLLCSGYACKQSAVVSIRLCTEPFEQNVCISNQDTFTFINDNLYLSCRFVNPPEDGKATISLHFNGQSTPLLIEEKNIAVGETNAGHVFNYIHTFQHPPGWANGTYTLRIQEHFGNNQLFEKRFSIGAQQSLK